MNTFEASENNPNDRDKTKNTQITSPTPDTPDRPSQTKIEEQPKRQGSTETIKPGPKQAGVE